MASPVKLDLDDKPDLVTDPPVSPEVLVESPVVHSRLGLNVSSWVGST